jgi:uncharacterized protein (DUF427 family)
MSKGHAITTERTGERVVVSIEGVVVADSRDPVVLHETGLPPRYYLPLEDVKQEYLSATDHQTHCPFKGDASYYSVSISGTTHENIVWTYGEPLEHRVDIAGRLAFYNERATITVDGPPR